MLPLSSLLPCAVRGSHGSRPCVHSVRRMQRCVVTLSPLPSRRHPHRKLYHALQHVCSLLRYVVRDSGPSPVAPEVGDVSNVLQCACQSLQHSGPLGREALSLHLRLQPAAVLRALVRHQMHLGLQYRFSISADSRSTACVVPAPPLSSWLATRWGRRAALLEEYWVQAVHSSRKSSRLQDGFPDRYESGSTIFRLLNDVEDRICARDGSDCHQALENTVERRSLQLLREDLMCHVAYVPDRSAVFELQNALQEIGLLKLLQEAVQAYEHGLPGRELSEKIACVIDAGGGNGYLALHLAQHIASPGGSIVVDRFIPAHSVDSPTHVAQWQDTQARVFTQKAAWVWPIRRVVKAVEDVDWRTDVMYQPAQTALVSKHLCGTAVDAFLRRLDWGGCLPPVLVLSPCCYNKGTWWEYLNMSYLKDVLGVADEASWNALTVKTDWNASEKMSVQHACCSVTRASNTKETKSALKLAETALSNAWLYNVSNLIHAALDEGRLLWLRQRGYECTLVTFAPAVVTPKNVAIVAVYRGGRYFIASG